MQNGGTQIASSSAAPASADIPVSAGNTTIPRNRVQASEPSPIPSVASAATSTGSPSKTRGNRISTFGSLASWSEPVESIDSLRQASGSLQTSGTQGNGDGPCRRDLLFAKRTPLWPRSTKREIDPEQGLTNHMSHRRTSSSQATSATASSRASHRSQPSTGSTGRAYSESRASLQSSAVASADSPARYSRFREQLGESNDTRSWTEIPISRPQTASSSAPTIACPYPPIPDPQDKANRLGKNQLWFQRTMVWLIILVLNGACVIAYVQSTRHLWVLVLILFVKAKDLFSTLISLSYLSSRFLWREVSSGQLEDVPAKQILSMITCYNETEEQIMKTIDSICENELDPHSQILCLIVDGKPKELIKRRILRIAATMRRPYVTWQDTRNEVVIDCGYLDGVPVIYIEKVKNTGKKDSLILGHDLFNVMREDAPQYTKLLREEIWSSMMPSLMMLPGSPRIDAIFCTDADSTIHKDALKRLVESLALEKRAIAACGILLAELGDTEWTIWSLFQQFQYCYGQFVRRMAEGVWGRVTCLPGCITMVAVRPEMRAAISDYARPVRDKTFFRHQVQYLGTDRRLTYSMLSQSTRLKTVFVPSAVSETVVPQSLSHYLAQRRRWGSNAYFNDWFYLLGPNQFLITRLWALIDISRMTIVYCRQANNILFIYGLARNFAIIKIIPLLIVTQIPTLWFITFLLTTQPLLRRRIHKVVMGLLINYCISWFLSILVFTRIVAQLGSTAWGKTGMSTAGHDPTLRVRTLRNSVARRLSSLFGSSSSDDSDSRHSRRSSMLRRMSFSVFHRSSRASSLPPVTKSQDDTASSRPSTARGAVGECFANRLWRSSRDRLSRGPQHSATVSQTNISESAIGRPMTVHLAGRDSESNSELSRDSDKLSQKSKNSDELSQKSRNSGGRSQKSKDSDRHSQKPTKSDMQSRKQPEGSSQQMT